jgi:predicted acyltransferase
VYSHAKRVATQTFENTLGIELTEEEEKELKKIDELETIASTEVTEPDFPMIMFMIALVIDILGILDFSGFGWFVMCIVEIVFTIILFFHMFGRMSMMFKASSKVVTGKTAQRVYGRLAKRYLRKYLSRRAIAILIVKVIPFIGILASNAFFVFLAHNKQKKIAQGYMKLVIMVSNALKGHYRRIGIEE